ncbi:MAG TPA: hypothetical protein VGM56_08505 [Byssovorax sp.]
MLAVVMVGGAVVVGCGGIGDAENLFSESVGGATPGATTSAGGASPTSSTGPGATTHTSTTNTGPTVTATSTTTTTTGPTTTTVSSTGANMAQSSSATSTVAVTVSSSSTGTSPTITCGAFNCPTNNGGACCSNIFAHGGGVTSCVSSSDPTQCDNRPDQSGFSSLITCDAPMDCPGQACCGHLVFAGGGDYYDTVNCQTSCDYNSGQVTLCDPGEPDQGHCPIIDDGQGNQVQSHCTQSSLLPMGYFVCTT